MRKIDRCIVVHIVQEDDPRIIISQCSRNRSLHIRRDRFLCVNAPRMLAGVVTPLYVFARRKDRTMGICIRS